MQSATTFGQRFRFSRLWQSIVSVEESDREFAFAVFQQKNSSSMSDYRRANETPNSLRVGEMAVRLGVDYKWLTGTAAEPADGFADRELFVAAWQRWLLAHGAEVAPPGLVEIDREPSYIAAARKAGGVIEKGSAIRPGTADAEDQVAVARARKKRR
jgi:hypothetical protein